MLEPALREPDPWDRPRKEGAPPLEVEKDGTSGEEVDVFQEHKVAHSVRSDQPTTRSINLRICKKQGAWWRTTRQNMASSRKRNTKLPFAQRTSLPALKRR